MTLPAEGWYPDPSGPPWVNRWWSGTEWTDRTQMMPPPPSSQSASGGPQLAGYGLRLGAWLLDFVFVSVISVPLLIPFGGVFHRTNSQLVNGNGTFTNHSVTYGIHGVGLLVQAALVLLYGMFFVGSRRAQTPGMMIAGIRCMRSDRNVVRVGHGKALLRAFVEYLLAVALFIPWVIDMLFPLWDGQNQTLHDKAAGTVVVRSKGELAS